MLWFYLTHVTNGIFSAEIPLHWRIVRHSKESHSKMYYLIRLRRHVSDLLLIIRFAETVLTPRSPTAHAWIIKNEIKKNSADLRMWRYSFENHFLIRLRRRLPVKRFSMLWYKTTWLSSERSALVIKSIRLSHYTFLPQHFHASRQRYSWIHA